MKISTKINKLVKSAVSALEDIKARDIVVLDVRTMTSLYDTLIIATAESARQTKALSVHVRDDVKAAGGHIIGSEGEDSGEWVLVDCGDFVVHIMQPAVRAHYNLEELWTPPEPVRKATPSATKKPVVKKAPPKKAATEKNPAAKKVVAKKSALKKPAVKKAAVKKVAVKKVATKAPAAKAATKPAPIATRRRLKTPV